MLHELALAIAMESAFAFALPEVDVDAVAPDVGMLASGSGSGRGRFGMPKRPMPASGGRAGAGAAAKGDVPGAPGAPGVAAAVLGGGASRGSTPDEVEVEAGMSIPGPCREAGGSCREAREGAEERAGEKPLAQRVPQPSATGPPAVHSSALSSSL